MKARDVILLGAVALWGVPAAAQDALPPPTSPPESAPTDAIPVETTEGTALVEAAAPPPAAPQLEEVAAQVERLAVALEEARQQQAELSQRLEAQAAPTQPEPEAETPLVDYNPDTGLHFRLAPKLFELNLRGFLWARYTYSASGATGHEISSRVNSFSVPQTRLKFTAIMADGLFKATIQPSVAPGWAGIQDGFLELCLAPWANFRMGKMLVNYDWESNTAPPVVPFVGLSPLVSFFGHGRDLGLMFYGTAAGRVTYSVAAFNGNRESPNDNRQFLFAGNVRYQVLGSLAPGWGWTDLKQSDEFNLTLGAGATYDGFSGSYPDARDSESGFGYHARQWQTTGNVHLRYRGVSLVYVAHAQGRYLDFPGTQEAMAEAAGVNADKPIYSQGNLVYLGYVPWREHLEIFGRFTHLKHNLDVEGDPGIEALGGLTLFLLGQNAKLTAQYAYQRNMPTGVHTPSAETAHVVQVEAQGWF